MHDCSSQIFTDACLDAEVELGDFPTRLFVETTNRCNQSCVMCQRHRPGSVQRREGDLDLATFKSLEGALGYLDALVLNGVGEPLLNVHLEQFVMRAKKLMPSDSWVGFRSNGILLTNMRAISLVDAGLDRICLSMDGVDVATSGAVRAGSQVLDLEWAMKALSSAKSICGRPAVAVGVEYVVEPDNLEELPAALEWAASRGASFAVVSRLRPFPEEAAPGLPATRSEEARELFEGWRKTAQAQGLDITRYFHILWKYHKTPAERRVINLVAAMKGEAQQRGIDLDLKRLISVDGRRHQESRNVFEDAVEVARKAGLDLRLPEDGEEGRGCASQEQGGAFISWDGRMLPCYRLWDECRSGAPTRPGDPRSFGNVLEEDILDIWNSAPFRSYREWSLNPAVDPSRPRGCYACSPPQRRDAGERSACQSCLWSSGMFRVME